MVGTDVKYLKAVYPVAFCNSNKTSSQSFWGQESFLEHPSTRPFHACQPRLDPISISFTEYRK